MRADTMDADALLDAWWLPAGADLALRLASAPPATRQRIAQQTLLLVTFDPAAFRVIHQDGQRQRLLAEAEPPRELLAAASAITAAALTGAREHGGEAARAALAEYEAERGALALVALPATGRVEVRVVREEDPGPGTLLVALQPQTAAPISELLAAAASGVEH